MFLLKTSESRVKQNAMTHVTPKTMLVTGGAKRIGRAIALHGARLGYDVAVHYRKARIEAEAVVSEIIAMGRRAVTVRGDLLEPESASAMIESARASLGSVDVLVNNASTFHESTLMQFDLNELNHEIRVNAFLPLLLARHFASKTSQGAVVNLLDSRINSYDKTHAAYHLSKRMLYDITRMLALELSPGIRVNGVAPGLILPPAGADEGYLETHKTENPLKRHGSPEEIAEAVLFLADAPFITGQVIYVDGGRHLNSSVYG